MKRYQPTGMASATVPSPGAPPSLSSDAPAASEARRLSVSTLRADMLVIVRPPPSKQNHPLNLQIQMINHSPELKRTGTASSASDPSSIAAVTNATATSFPREAEPQPPSRPATPGSETHSDRMSSTSLKRSGSVRSIGSTGTTGTSFSFGSERSGVSSTRKVQPLYNLHWHTVLPTWISDAGTDAKIARFGKRGIEINDLAHIEPSELPSPVQSTDALMHRDPSPSRQSSIVLSSQSGLPPSPSSTSPATFGATANGEDKGPAAFFHKFKKLGFKKTSPSLPSSASSHSSLSRPTNHLPTNPAAAAAQLGGVAKATIKSAISGAAGGVAAAAAVASGGESDELPSTNGAMASVGPAVGSGRRARGYMWTVKKWTKPGWEGSAPPVTIEWRRGPKSRRGARGALKVSRGQDVSGMGSRGDDERRTASDATGMRPRPRSACLPGGEIVNSDIEGHRRVNSGNWVGMGPNMVISGSEAMARSETVSPTGNGHHQENGPPSQQQQQHGPGHVDAMEEDEDEESDAEDSERPWSCTLTLPGVPPSPSSSSPPTSPALPSSPKLLSVPTSPSSVMSGFPSHGHHNSPGSSTSPSSKPRQLHLGIAKPHPHHPRAIATLIIPSTLSPIRINLGSPTTTSFFTSPQTQLHQLITPTPRLTEAWLTVEEMKDLVAVTCLWLCVKESLGGLGTRRKGDGSWRIGKKV